MMRIKKQCSLTRLRTIAATCLVLITTISAHAQINGDYTYDGNKKAYFTQGTATIDGNIAGNDVFVGKNNAAQFTSMTSNTPHVLNIIGDPQGNSGAYTTYNADYPKYPDGHIYGGIAAFGNSAVHMSGGQVADEMVGYENSTIDVTGGHINMLGSTGNSKVSLTAETYIVGGKLQLTTLVNNCFIQGHGTLDVRGLKVGPFVTGYPEIKHIDNVESGTLTMDTAEADEVWAYGNSTTTLGLDSNVKSLLAGDNSKINSFFNQISQMAVSNNNVTVLSDTIVGNLITAGNSHLSAFGLSNISLLTARGSSTVEIGQRNYGLEPTIHDLFGRNDSVITLNRGHIEEAWGYDNCKINLVGGTIGQHTLRLFDNSSLTLYGTGLSLTFSSAGSDDNGSYNRYVLSGTLAHGGSVDGVNLLDYVGGNEIMPGNPNAPNSLVTFLPASAAAPEPASMMLMLSFPLLMAVQGRCKRQFATT